MKRLKLASKLVLKGVPRMTVQWKSWLSHTRALPPTLEACCLYSRRCVGRAADERLKELKLDYMRQEQLRVKVAAIEARDREERLRLAAEQKSIPRPISQPRTLKPEEPPSAPPGTNEGSVRTPRRPCFVPKNPDNYEPESWIPKSARRGSMA